MVDVGFGREAFCIERPCHLALARGCCHGNWLVSAAGCE